MCSSPPSSFFFSPLIRIRILRLFLVEKKSSKFFIPFLHLDQFRVLVSLVRFCSRLGTDQEEDKDALLLVDECNDDDNMERNLRLRLFACGGLKHSLLPRKGVCEMYVI